LVPWHYWQELWRTCQRCVTKYCSNGH